ncbi:MAG: hypothetical protein HY787_00835, partial [Deltaproteobacteria bacterium]|nr:hypothetical protein [Deltaproteobacteria bacterium]
MTPLLFDFLKHTRKFFGRPPRLLLSNNIFHFNFWKTWCIYKRSLKAEGTMEEKINQVVEMIAEANKVVVFTGAGVST